ncbi:MAG: type II secretion system protein [Gemmatimonadales bacterium]|nr:type II secretion system protein [Gemmatimonadales bacterium]
MKRDRSGFTLVEVLVAVTVLGIGVSALVSSSAMVTRMIGRGKTVTQAAQIATQRIELLRAAGYSTTPRCTAGAFASGGPVTTSGITQSWVVDAAGGVRNIAVSVSYATPRGMRTSVLNTRIEC